MDAKFSEVLRRAVLDSGETRYELARRSGVSQASLSRFVHRQAGLSMEAADALIEALDLELRPRGRRKGD